MKKEINVDRRTFVKMAGMAVGALTLGNYGLIRFGLAQQGTPIQGSSIPQFIEPLPLLNVAGGPIETIAGENNVEIHMREIKVNILPQGFIPNYAGTSVFAYLNGSGIPNTPKETYIGPVIVATRNNPIEAKFVNDLGDTGTTQVKAWKESTDRTLHWADPLNEGMVNGHYGDSGPAPIPACVHLHGGEIPPVLDGGPDAWFTSDGMYHGHGFYTKDGSNSNYSIYKYPNTQEASPIWFHDHVLGITRLNVYAGLAGAYVVVDPDMILPAGLDPLGLQRTGHTLDYLIPLVIQDRMFDTTGELYFPNIGLNPEHPYWIPELVGDTIVVNGKTWPFMNVEPRRYRFLIINGSNARPYELFLTNPVSKANGPAIYQIASDGGYLETPAIIDPNAPKGQLQRLRLMPGERADIIIDFAGLQGQTLIIRNTAKTPYPAGTAPNGNTVGRILQFRVQNTTVSDDSYNPANGGQIRSNFNRLVNPTTGTLANGVTTNKTRLLTLNEIMGAGGPLEILVNNTKWDGLSSDHTTFPDGIRPDFTPVTIGGDTAYYSETPNEGDTELWEIVNLTADAHPIHTHLTQFQLMNRQNFNTNKYNGAYTMAFGGIFKPAYGPPLAYNFTDPVLNPQGKLGGNPDITPYLQGPITLPDANETGWKDTIMMLPGQVTRIVVRYAPMNKAINDSELSYPFDPNVLEHGYVWHCHIIDHEDNEMMRPYKVNPKNVARSVTDF